MLRNFDNRLNADVIRALRAMGHGDDLVISDTNFPSDSVARQTVIGKAAAHGQSDRGRGRRSHPLGDAAR